MMCFLVGWVSVFIVWLYSVLSGVGGGMFIFGIGM